MKVSVSPWKLTLPGKILAIFVCVLPFLTRSITLTVTEEERAAFFFASTRETITDFEQLCREIALITVMGLALLWFVYERITMRPRRPISITPAVKVMMGMIGGYLLLGLISTIASPHQSAAWIGRSSLYEGYLALLGYGLLFAAAWFWTDRKEVVAFVQNALTALGIVVGVLILLEHLGICYYNMSIVQSLAGIQGYVSYDSATLTFGNPDYLGMYAAMLLPLLTSLIFCADSEVQRLIRIVSAVLMAAVLILTKVSNAILIGFGLTLALLLVILLRHVTWSRVIRGVTCGVVALAVLAGGFGFVYTRSGDTVSEKLRHTIVGIEQEQTFRLLSAALDASTVTLENADVALQVTATQPLLSADTLTISCNGKEVVPQQSGGILTFAEPELAHCQIELQTDRLAFDLGYATPLETIWTGTNWQAVGLGGVILDQVPQVSDSKWLQEKYTYLNGRVFIWANTVGALSDCLLIGHGPSTALFYFNQQDLPALLNIFGQYVVYDKPHNWYLQMAQDTGVLSAVLIIGALGIFIACGGRRCFGKSKKQTQVEPDQQQAAWQMGLWFAVASYALTGTMNDSLIYHAPMFWFLLGVGTRTLMHQDVPPQAARTGGKKQ